MVAVISPTVISGVAVSPYARVERIDVVAVPVRLRVSIVLVSFRCDAARSARAGLREVTYFELLLTSQP